MAKGKSTGQNKVSSIAEQNVSPYKRALRDMQKVDELDRIKANLTPRAPLTNVVDALISSGLSATCIGEVAGVSAESVQNWRKGIQRPYGKHRYPVDDLRIVMGTLLIRGELKPEAAVDLLNTPIDFDEHDSIITPLEALKVQPNLAIDHVDNYVTHQLGKPVDH